MPMTCIRSTNIIDVYLVAREEGGKLTRIGGLNSMCVVSAFLWWTSPKTASDSCEL